MKLSIKNLINLVAKEKIRNILILVIYGLLGSFLVKDIITPLLFTGRSFAGKSLLIRIALFLIYLVCFVLFFYVIQRLYKRFMSENNSPVIFNQIGKPQKTIILALITLAVGVLTIFIINNLIARIDTQNWKLKGLDIIPIMKPIGNDFLVGLYEPAENLVKNGFKGISSDGTYPSYYPPLVNVLSLPYLIFYPQNAYLVHTMLIFFLNFIVLLITTLIVDELFLRRITDNQFTRTLLSILLFIVIAFYNFSSYPFLFSMERGNVDVIAMFFMMLSMWTLIKQPKNIWLQVIFLSIATHYKIYPAVLFLILLYCHGKKLILPMLVVNLAFLFVLGPKTAWAFITSITSVGNESDVGNRWTWVGNHGAYSFAESLTLYYPRLTGHIFNLFLVSTIIPVTIWIMGTIRILKNKFTPLNAILLLMITLPLMDLLPTISHDYRLIIQTTTFLLYIGLILAQIIEKPSGNQIIELFVLTILMFLIARPYDAFALYSYKLKETSSFFINNKYLWCLALEALMVINMFLHNKRNPILQKQSNNQI